MRRKAIAFLLTVAVLAAAAVVLEHALDHFERVSIEHDLGAAVTRDYGARSTAHCARSPRRDDVFYCDVVVAGDLSEPYVVNTAGPGFHYRPR